MASRPKMIRGRAATSREAEALLLEIGAALHTAGASAHRVEGAMAELAEVWGTPGGFFATPTSLQAVFGERHEQRHALLRLEPGEVALGRLASVEDIVREAGAGRATPRMARVALDRALAGANPWGPAAEVAAALALGAVASVFFGGQPGHMGVGALASVAVYATGRGLTAFGAGRLGAVVGAAVGTGVAITGARMAGLGTAWPALVGGIIALAPGYGLTVAATEIAAGHLISGSARLVAAASTFLQLLLGIAAVAGAFGAWTSGELALAGPASGAGPWVAAALAGPCFTVLLQARARDGWLLLAGSLGGYAAYVLADAALGGWWTPLAAAALVSAGSELLSRRSGRPAALTLVPALLTLVPGGAGLGSLSLILREDAAGVAAAVATGMAAVALATGVLVGAALVARRVRPGSRARHRRVRSV